MKQGDFLNEIAITLQHSAEDVDYLTLSLGAQADQALSLSLPDARRLAYSLIQHVHLADVRRSLKKTTIQPA